MSDLSRFRDLLGEQDERTLITPSALVTITAGRGESRGRSLCRSIALACACYGLVDDLSRRRRLAVGVELRVIAFFMSVYMPATADEVDWTRRTQEVVKVLQQ